MVEDANPVAPGPPPEDIHHSDGRAEHPSVDFEPTDVRFRGVLIVMLASLAIGSLIFCAVSWFFGDYNRHQSAIKQSAFPLAPAPSMQLPADPRLEQVDRMARIDSPNVFLREESKENILNSTGPTAERGFVHIPIERAMERVVEQLPVRKDAPRGAAKDNGLVDGGEPNSGRLLREGTR